MPDPTPHEPTERTIAQAEALKSYGNTDDEIADFLGISPKTLIKYYGEILKNARVKANAAVAGKLFKKATVENDLAAMIFWLKTRARWRQADDRDEKDSAASVLEKILNGEITIKKND